jgi:guanylate kinase
VEPKTIPRACRLRRQPALATHETGVQRPPAISRMRLMPAGQSPRLSPPKPKEEQERGARTAARRGLLLVVSSPSGAGKTTLARRLLASHEDLRFSVSYTTRARRRGEQDAVDYHFVSDAEFDRMVSDDAFAEWCVVHGRKYGTAVETVAATLASGQQVLLDIDYQGAEKLAKLMPAEARLVFILPPSFTILEQRLRARGTDSDAVIEQRLIKAREELSHYRLYHYLVTNNQLDEAYAELEAIYEYERALVLQIEPSQGAALLAQACRCENRAALAEEVLSSVERTGSRASV